MQKLITYNIYNIYKDNTNTVEAKWLIVKLQQPCNITVYNHDCC